MAEICCEPEKASDVPREVSSRTTRRRRCKLVDGVVISGDLTLKRQRPLLVPTDPGSAALNLGFSPEATIRPDWCPMYGVTSICGRRRDMEDCVSIQPDLFESRERWHFFGVFDGHGCSHVAVCCKERMHEIVREEMSSSEGEEEWRGIMERSFLRMDAEAVARAGGKQQASCRCELQSPKCEHVGSTAVVAAVSSNRIVVANCGDSRSVLCRRGGAVVPLSSDHKPDRPDELRRIEEAGGRVIYWEGARVLGVLAMSRAIGDSYLKPFVVAEPEVTVTERTEEDECLILASDGLWDVVSNEMACNIARMCLRGSRTERRRGEAAETETETATPKEASDKACREAALLLTRVALARKSADNISVVVIDLRS